MLEIHLLYRGTIDKGTIFWADRLLARAFGARDCAVRVFAR